MAEIDISPEKREVLVDGAPVALGARAFDVLAYLDAHKDRVVSKAELRRAAMVCSEPFLDTRRAMVRELSFSRPRPFGK